jgi:outer membrane protein OmpA-like peptidoglycan-associated protein/Mg-chelatase subunit ChlD
MPLIAEHPMWGKKDLTDFKVVEIHSKDSIEYYKALQKREEILKKLNEEKDNLITLIQREKNLIEKEKLVEARKAAMDSLKIEDAKQTSVVLVMDISGSMSGEPLVNAKRAVSEFLKFSDAEVAIVAFNTQIYPIIMFSTNRDSLVQSFLSIEADGGTSFYDALYYTLDLLGKRYGKKQVIAITDGITGDDSYSMSDVIQKAMNMNVIINAQTSDAVNIFTIGFGRENDNLVELAKQTNSKSYYALTDQNLLEAFSDYLGFDLEFTLPDISLLVKLEEVNKKIEIATNLVYQEFYYQISFKLPFTVEDGLEQIVSLKFADQNITQTIKVPISTTEFLLQGYITDKVTGDSIAGATIVINPHEIDKTFSCKSDSTGFYEILIDKTYGEYSVITSSDSYFIHTEELELARKDKYFIKLNRSLPRIENGIRVALRTIHFEDNEFLFEPVSFNDLICLCKYFVSHPQFVVEVAGHTDSYGNDPYNQWLSERRAETVAEYLTGLGFPVNQISYKGFGESKLLVPDDSPENRYINRRINIQLIDILDTIRQN